MNCVYKDSYEGRLKLKTLTKEDFEDSHERRFLRTLGNGDFRKTKAAAVHKDSSEQRF